MAKSVVMSGIPKNVIELSRMTLLAVAKREEKEPKDLSHDTFANK